MAVAVMPAATGEVMTTTATPASSATMATTAAAMAAGSGKGRIAFGIGQDQAYRRRGDEGELAAGGEKPPACFQVCYRQVCCRFACFRGAVLGLHLLLLHNRQQTDCFMVRETNRPYFRPGFRAG